MRASLGLALALAAAAAAAFAFNVYAAVLQTRAPPAGGAGVGVAVEEAPAAGAAGQFVSILCAALAGALMVRLTAERCGGLGTASRAMIALPAALGLFLLSALVSAGARGAQDGQGRAPYGLVVAAQVVGAIADAGFAAAATVAALAP
jgi:hypothetical protein